MMMKKSLLVVLMLLGALCYANKFSLYRQDAQNNQQVIENVPMYNFSDLGSFTLEDDFQITHVELYPPNDFSRVTGSVIDNRLVMALGPSAWGRTIAFLLIDDKTGGIKTDLSELRIDSSVLINHIEFPQNKPPYNVMIIYIDVPRLGLTTYFGASITIYKGDEKIAWIGGSFTLLEE